MLQRSFQEEIFELNSDNRELSKRVSELEDNETHTRLEDELKEEWRDVARNNYTDRISIWNQI